MVMLEWVSELIHKNAVLCKDPERSGLMIALLEIADFVETHTKHQERHFVAWKLVKQNMGF